LPYLLCLAIAASSQPTDAQLPLATTRPTPVAHVYVQTSLGVNLYNASATGQLTLAAGLPFLRRCGLHGLTTPVETVLEQDGLAYHG
jgi:hypothetical protein